MEKFKKNKKILLIGGMSLILVSGITFCINSKEKYKPQEISRELIAMFVQDENGEYNANPSKEFPKEGYVLNTEKSNCKNGGFLSQDPTTKKISMTTNHADQCTLYFDKVTPTLEDFYDNVTKKTEVPNFAIPAMTDETEDGLFSMQDDYGTSYYFRGTAPNNYVKFGRNADGQDMWWRIIRFNGDGSVRVQYDGAGTAGTNTYTRGFALTNQVWNSYYNDAKYVGWMFGKTNGSTSTNREEAQRNETDSEIKKKVDEWYKKNVEDTGYGNYVADAIFCNDRSTPGKNVTNWTRDTGLGYGTNITAFGALGKFLTGNKGTNLSANTKPQPQFTCPQENDKFTVKETSGGNGALTYPVGLITADEIVAAGSGQYGTTNENYYLNKRSWYRSFSPYYINASAFTRIFDVGSGGQLNSNGVDNMGSIAPVINLKAEYSDKLQGEGMINNPFILQV